MSNNRLIAIFAMLVLLVAAAFTIGSGIAPAPVVSNGALANDYSVRHPEMLSSRTNVEPLDYIQRHPESLNPGNAVDLSDYYARHPGASIALVSTGAPDWFERHPESLNPGNAVDLSDYYQRHSAALMLLNTAGAPDWFQRHPELLRSGSGLDSSRFDPQRENKVAREQQQQRLNAVRAVPAGLGEEQAWRREQAKMMRDSALGIWASGQTDNIQQYPESALQRHPELLKSVGPAVDRRFPGKEKDDLATVDLSDYFARHPASVR